MRKPSSLIILAAALFLSAPALAQDLELPYPDFKPGSPAYADSVDANFEALRTGINGNAGKITVNRDGITANAASIGANASSITSVKRDLAAHGHEPGDINPQGSGSGMDADVLDGRDSEDFADSAHSHVPADLASQGPGSGLDADRLDGRDSEDFADSAHSHVPADLAPQGPGSGLDADRLDGVDSADFASSVHGHDEKYTLVGHLHSGEEITGPINADTLDDLDSSFFAQAEHAHQDYALTIHEHDGDYAALSHTHDELAAAMGEQESRIGRLESYGDLSSVLDEITALKKTVADLRSRVEELEKKLKEASGN